MSSLLNDDDYHSVHMPAAEDEKDAARVFYVAATRATLRWLIVSVRLWQSTDTESTAERHVNMHGL